MHHLVDLVLLVANLQLVVLVLLSGAGGGKVNRCHKQFFYYAGDYIMIVVRLKGKYDQRTSLFFLAGTAGRSERFSAGERCRP